MTREFIESVNMYALVNEAGEIVEFLDNEVDEIEDNDYMYYDRQSEWEYYHNSLLRY